jgi:hypothetical protein
VQAKVDGHGKVRTTDVIQECHGYEPVPVPLDQARVTHAHARPFSVADSTRFDSRIVSVGLATLSLRRLSKAVVFEFIYPLRYGTKSACSIYVGWCL